VSVNQMVCIKKYDPYYGFKIIEVGAVVVARDNQNGLFRLESEAGRLLGTISKSELAEYFQEAA
jgi:hypothetical protein